MIKDAFCVMPRVGDRVAYAPGGAGAQDFRAGKISKITDKTVTIVDHGELDCMNQPKMIRRGSGCFVIDMDSRNPGMIGKANSWASFDNHIRQIVGPASELRAEVSSELHKDGCASAWVHHAHFVDALVEKYEESLND
ncbi:hypothetical protein P7_090 [Pectobacterium phage vB_PcaM_P7_Pc]|nr:hypothetical protein P7_090 [Pectobacterium phage vB_PcaM_P7_Pc]